jgi:hypothetical protein
MVSMANRLSTEKRAQVLGCLVEGMSIRATVRATGAAKNTVTKLLVDIGKACEEYLDTLMQDLPCVWIEADDDGAPVVGPLVMGVCLSGWPGVWSRVCRDRG